jgi:hypothetical protein
MPNHQMGQSQERMERMEMEGGLSLGHLGLLLVKKPTRVLSQMMMTPMEQVV